MAGGTGAGAGGRDGVGHRWGAYAVFNAIFNDMFNAMVPAMFHVMP